MADDIWFYVRDSQQLGPVPLEAIQSAILQKQITPTDLVWRDGMADWMPARSVAEVMPRSRSSFPLLRFAISASIPTATGWAGRSLDWSWDAWQLWA